jgi:hypothetical protein
MKKLTIIMALVGILIAWLNVNAWSSNVYVDSIKVFEGDTNLPENQRFYTDTFYANEVSRTRFKIVYYRPGNSYENVDTVVKLYTILGDNEFLFRKWNEKFSIDTRTESMKFTVGINWNTSAVVSDYIIKVYINGKINSSKRFSIVQPGLKVTGLTVTGYGVGNTTGRSKTRKIEEDEVRQNFSLKNRTWTSVENFIIDKNSNKIYRDKGGPKKVYFGIKYVLNGKPVGTKVMCLIKKIYYVKDINGNPIIKYIIAPKAMEIGTEGITGSVFESDDDSYNLDDFKKKIYEEGYYIPDDFKIQYLIIYKKRILFDKIVDVHWIDDWQTDTADNIVKKMAKSRTKENY